MKNKIFTTKFIAGVGILAAVEIVLYIVSCFFKIGVASINLALVPIAIGAIVYGPVAGGLLGLLNGICVILTPDQFVFFTNTEINGDLSAIGFFVVCFTKCTIAGIVSAYLYRLLNKHEIAAAITASLIVPVINTGIYMGLACIFFNKNLGNLIQLALLINFIVEFASTLILSPAVIRITGIYRLKNNNTISNGEGTNEKE